MAPSSGPVVHVRARLRNDGSPVSSPLRAASRWYVGHSVVVDTAGVCDGAWLVAGADDPPSEQPASSRAVTMVIARWTADRRYFSYRPSMSAAYFSATTFRFTLRVGVSSSPT